MEFIFKWEGGYVNDPKDPGGETNFGISKRAHPNVDIKNLTKEQAKEIYKVDYWDRITKDSDTILIKAMLMNAAVNQGLNRANVYRMLYASYGNAELAIDAAVRARYFDIIANNSSLAKFLKGWFNRTNDLISTFQGKLKLN